MVAAGLGGPIAGRGYSLGIVDDFLKNREDAESRPVRDKLWDSFTNDFLTRRAPVSITLIVATPWHVDDIIGRIRVAMKEDAAFPRFEFLRFPAFDEAYPTGTLFPERFDLSWYEAQRASLGPYGTASLLQCDPRPREGNLLKTDMVKIVETLPDGLRWVRGWDLASTTRQLVRSDPDYTVGALVAVQTLSGFGGMAKRRLYVADVLRGRWEAPERDRRILQTAISDGPGVAVVTESAGGYKDTYTRLKELLSGIRNVEKVTASKDLVLRGGALAPLFEAGEVYFLRGPWCQAVLTSLGEFPSGAHDDDLAAILAGFEFASKGRLIMGLFEYLRQAGDAEVSLSEERAKITGGRA